MDELKFSRIAGRGFERSYHIASQTLPPDGSRIFVTAAFSGGFGWEVSLWDKHPKKDGGGIIESHRAPSYLSLKEVQQVATRALNQYIATAQQSGGAA